MSISSSALKGLVGLGAVSTVAIGGGGTYLYNRQNTPKILEEDKIEESYGDSKEISQNFIKKLGIETGYSGQEHDLTEEQIEKIKFEGESNLEIKNITGLKLKIEKTNETDIFPGGLKFTFVTGDGMDQIGISTEFRIKVTGKDEYSLEKAWTKEALAAKVGLVKNGTGNAFTFRNGTKVNVYKRNVILAESTINDSDKSKEVTIVEAKGYNQGFKITVSEDINLSEGVKIIGGDMNIKLDSKKFYSIEHKSWNAQTRWYFVEKDSNPS